MRRRIQLRAELVGPQRIFGRFEAVLLIGVDLPFLRKSFEIGAGFGRREDGRRKPDPSFGDAVRKFSVTKPF
jgi:hypothetical protein